MINMYFPFFPVLNFFFVFFFWIPDLPQTILSPNVELVFLSLLWTGFVPSFFFCWSLAWRTSRMWPWPWLQQQLCVSSHSRWHNVDGGFCDNNNNDVFDPDSVLDGNDNNNGTFALRSKILSMIICSPNCDVTPDFLSLALPFTSNIKSNITNVRFLRYLFTYV